MLKKLVKYGNSNALVLDKALLELLNIGEGSVVKIKTDGASLIITPQYTQTNQPVTPTLAPQEMLQDAIKRTLSSSLDNSNNAQNYISELSNLFAKYAQALEKLNAPELKHAFKEVEDKFEGNFAAPEYINAKLTLCKQFAPELAQLDSHVHTISQKYIPAQSLNKTNQNNVAFALTDFKRVHEKYNHVLMQVTHLLESPDFIHESVLLAEKYQNSKNSPEYIQEYNQLIAKQIPEYAVYQNELKMVGQALQ